MPREIVGILDLVLRALLLHLEENFDLSYMDRHEGLDSHSDLLVHVLKTHLGKLLLDVVDELLLFLELSNFLLIALFEALLDVLSPEHLHTEKSDLRWVHQHELLDLACH